MRWMGCVALGVAIFGSTVGQAADFKNRTIRVSSTVTEAHPVGSGIAVMRKCLLDRSGGNLKLQPAWGGALGGDTQSVQAMRAGSLDLATVATSSLVSVLPEAGLFDLPYLINTEADADRLLDGAVGQKISANLEKAGLVNLGYWENGFRHVTNSRRAITKWEDLSGLKMRVLPSRVYIDTFKAFGSNPIAMDFTEVMAALEMKAVDGLDNTIANIFSLKIYEAQKYLSLTHHTFNPLPLIMSKKRWDDLSADEKEVLSACATQGRDEERRVLRAQEAETVAKLRSLGIAVNELSPQELGRMKAQVESVYKEYAATIGADLIKEARQEVGGEAK